jgi:hypothetical protein
MPTMTRTAAEVSKRQTGPLSVASINIDLDMGKFSDDTPTRRAIDGACKRLSRRWVNAMTS